MSAVRTITGRPGAPTAVLIDGHASSEAWVLDRGLHFGDGVFETLSCRKGRPRFLSLHLERLREGCRRLHLPLVDEGILRSEILQLAAQGDDAIVKLIFTRGGALARGYGYTGGERATRVLLRYPSPPLEPSPGFRVDLAALRLGENPALAGIKHLNRLEQILAQREREERALDELLVLSRSGRLVSGVASNVFLVRQRKILTPSVDLCGVAGILRRVVLREARRAGMVCEERQLGPEDLEEAQEVFLSSSRLGVVPVVAVGERRFEAGPLTRGVQAMIAPMLENPVDE